MQKDVLESASESAPAAPSGRITKRGSSNVTSSMTLEDSVAAAAAAGDIMENGPSSANSHGTTGSPKSPNSCGDNGDGSSTSTLDSAEVRAALRLSTAQAFSSERAMSSGGHGPPLRRCSSRGSLDSVSNGSVRGAGWDDPAFEEKSAYTKGSDGDGDGDDHTGTTPGTDDGEDVGDAPSNEEADRARRKNKFSQALQRLGSSTMTELGSNKTSSKSKSKKARNKDRAAGNGQQHGHGVGVRFVPPVTTSSTSNLIAEQGGVADAAAMTKRASNESQLTAEGGAFRYHTRAYRRASGAISQEALGAMATTSTGMSESRHHYVDPYDPLPAGAATDSNAIHELPEAPRFSDDSDSSVGLSNPEDDPDDFKDNEDEERKNLSTKFRREYRSVAWTKLAVLAVLGASMAVVVVLIYRLAKNEERDDFKVQYDDLSAKVMSGFHHNMDMKVWSAYTLSVMYAHEGIEESAVGWPHVTLDDFYEQVEGILLTSHAGAKTVSFAPLVMDEDRASWEAYAAAEYDSEHSGPEVVNGTVPTLGAAAVQQRSSVWEDEGAASEESIFGGNDRRRGLLGLLRGGRRHELHQPRRDLLADSSRTVEDGIFGVTDGVARDQEEGRGYYLPAWQIAPKQDIDNHLMYDLNDEAYRERAIRDMLFYRRPTLTEIYDGHVDPFMDNRFGEPSGILFHPVFEDYCGSNIVGTIAIVFTIGPQFKGLPTHINGMTIVVETTGKQFTYNLDGGGYAQLIGMGDLHDNKYDDMVLEKPFNLQSYQVYDDDEREAGCARRVQADDLKEGQPLPPGAEPLVGDTPLPGFGVDADEVDPLVVYNVKIYPSQVFEDQYMTRNPAIFALVIAIIFLVTSATFVIYDCLVEKRQKVVMKTAVKSTKIVNNLFPSQVRDRLFHQESDHEPEEEEPGRDVLPMTVPGIVSPGGGFGADDVNSENCEGIADSDMEDEGGENVRVTKEGSAPHRRDSNDSSDPPQRQKRRGSLGGGGFVGLGIGGARKGGVSKVASNYSGWSSSDAHTVTTNVTMGIHGPPIADLFPNTTIMFADIAGFTAWSSEREPVQVFQLLESLYREFDRTAKRSGVFKVETIGDCYVAVAGLPDPQPDHALIMCKFAQKCLHRFSELSKELELSLGPGTADLGLRVGLHSGPVTAGVLRGERARFQLFGDTMNTASRMESTSLKNMVQISQATADILAASGREQMFIARQGRVQAKGKGEVQTYWLRPKNTRVASLQSYHEEEENDLEGERDDTVPKLTSETLHVANGGSGASRAPSLRNIVREASQRTASTDRSLTRNLSNSDLMALNDIDRSYHGAERGPSDQLQRLVKWNAAVLERFLVRVMDHSDIYQRMCHHPNMEKMMENFGDGDDSSEEAAEIIPSPWFDREGAKRSINRKKEQAKQLPEAARRELLEYVLRIALKYQAVHFHAFEHASHVLMSANKLMNKICSREFSRPPPSESSKEAKARRRDNEVGLFFSTFGIACDPLAQLAVVFAALIHDVEHTGVPNTRLAVENPKLAERFHNKSLAEQNSAHVAWVLLMEPEFVNLRQCMFSSACSRERFHKLLINVLIATDIADRDRIGREKLRWKNAFEGLENWAKEWKGKSDDELAKIDVSDKATCVLEQIVLASDIAHTMQHWLTFVKWNERLYKELWAAYRAGRAENDPTIGWYEGQIGFYDGYIIPLATKLKECGVFGTAGDEYLGNALRNKQEWIEKGREISARFDATIKNVDLQSSSDP